MATGGDYPFCQQPPADVPIARRSNIQQYIPPQIQPQRVKPASQKGLHGSGGYECEFVQPPTKAFQTDCSICLQVLREPHLISCCGHNFCQTCINRVKAGGKNCPLCNSANFSLMYNKGLERYLNELAVRCTNFKTGCQWTGELGSLNLHLNMNPNFENTLQGCGFVNLECSSCGKLFRRNLLANHQEKECPKRPYSCNYCQEYKSTFDDVAINHWPECKRYTLPCPNHCTLYVERQNLEQHLNKDCPFAVINCDFHYAGCEVQLPRKDMPAHIKENFNHLSLLSQLNLKRTVQLLKKDKEVEELRHELKEMSMKLNKLTEDHKQLDTYVEQGIEELRREAASDVEILREEIQGESEALNQEIGALKKRLDNKIPTKKQMNAALRREIGRIEEAQRGDIANLWEDVTELTEKQEQDRTELERQATGLCHLHKHGVVPVEIVMPDFERHKAAADQWLSDPFYTHPGGYKMCLSVYANGNDTGKGTHVSVYAYLMQGEFDHHLKWPLMCTFTIQLLNQTEDRKHHELTLHFDERDHISTCRVIEGEIATSGWGYPLFISHRFLCNPTILQKYSKNGCIHLRVAKFTQKH